MDKIGEEVIDSTQTNSNYNFLSDDKVFNLILLAKNYNGYKNLVKLSSAGYRNINRGKISINFDDLKKYTNDLIAIPTIENSELLSQILLNNDEEKIKKIIDDFLEIFNKEDFYLEIVASSSEEIKTSNEKIYEVAKKYDLKMLATSNVHYLEKEDSELQEIVMCIQSGVKLKDKNRKRIKAKDLYFKSRNEIEDILDEKFKIAIENTNLVAEKCNIEIKFGELQFPYYKVPKEFSSMDEYLKTICFTNLKNLYKENLNQEIIDRLNYELSIIYKMGYSGYFIVVWDFIAYAKSRGIPVGPGRGSAAGSLVSYCLGITMIDPIKYNLLFERFLNPERISMPDIDIDICRERREELIDYVIRKYGRERVAHIITFGRMKARAAIRDVGRVLDIDLAKIDRLAKIVPANMPLDRTLKENIDVARLYTSDIEIQKVIDFSIKLDNKVRHASTHAAGMLITKENLDESVPIYLDVKEGTVATQYQMKELEELGLLKIDFLGLKNLTNIQRTIDYIKEDKGIIVDLYNIDLNDKKVYKMLSNGDTIAVFQMESAGLRKIIRRLKPDKFEDIVALLSLYRPGPLQSGMVDDFINAKNGLTKIKYPDNSLEHILKETYGVILYQEQVMKIASFMASYSLGEADLLRRAMGKKDFVIMRENREKFVIRAIKNGYSQEKAEEIFDLIDKFAGYGFNKSHSVAYALVSYWTAYLKTYFPEHYYAAVLTSEAIEVENVAFYFNNAKEHNVKVFAPDVNSPSANFETKNGGIVFSLAAIKNIGMNLAEKIVSDFNKNGKYTSYENFVFRNKNNGLNKKSLEALVLSGALDSIKGNRKEKFLSISKVLDFTSKSSDTDEIQQMNLFGEAARTIDNFNLPISEDFSVEEKLQKEKELLGFYLSSHPIDKYVEIIDIFSLKKLSFYKKENNENILSFGMISNVKKIVTKKGEYMATFSLECYDEKISCVAFPRVYEENIGNILDKKFVFVDGKIQLDNYRGEEFAKLIVNKLILLDDLPYYKASKLFILIEPDDSSKYSRLKDLIKKNAGATKISFAIKNEEKKQIKDMNLGVKLSFELIKDLVELMGIEKIKIKI